MNLEFKNLYDKEGVCWKDFPGHYNYKGSVLLADRLGEIITSVNLL